MHVSISADEQPVVQHQRHGVTEGPLARSGLTNVINRQYSCHGFGRTGVALGLFPISSSRQVHFLQESGFSFELSGRVQKVKLEINGRVERQSSTL